MIEKYNTTNTTFLEFNGAADSEKVIFDHPIAELFNNSHIACPTTYASATISANDACTISAVYPFPVTCKTNVEAGYSKTLTLSFSQHQEPTYSIKVDVGQAAKPILTTTCNSVTDTTILDNTNGFTYSTSNITQTANFRCDSTQTDIFGCAALCGKTYRAENHTNNPDFNCAYDGDDNGLCQVCPYQIFNAQPLNMTKLTVCDACSPIAKLSKAPAVYEFQGNSSTKYHTLYNPLQTVFQNACRLPIAGTEYNLKTCTVSGAGNSYFVMSDDLQTAQLFNQDSAGYNDYNSVSLNCTKKSDGSFVESATFTFDALCFDTDLTPKHNTTNTTSLDFNGAAKGEKVIFDHPIAELFNNSHIACPTTYKNATISANDACTISAVYPFQVTCKTNVEAGYNKTLTLSFNQHQEPTFSIDVKVSQAANPSPSGGGAIWIIIVLLVLVIAGAGFYCYKKSNNKTELDEESEDQEGLKSAIM